jgi:small-conductance mechanosensitive channel
MKLSIEGINSFIVPIGFIISGIIVGFIVEKVFLHNVKRMAIRARWEGGRVIINSLRGISFVLFLIAGIYSALLTSDSIGPKMFAHLKLGVNLIVIFSATVVISRLATGFVKLYTGRILPSSSIFVNLTKVFVFIIGILVILQTMGISVAPIITALGVGGLAVALALQDTLSNLFAGLHIIASKKVKTGDYIRLDIGGEGFLEDITWRNTAIRTFQNNTIIVPNAKMASAVITNFNIPSKDLDVSITVGVSYDSDLTRVENITKEVAKEVLQSLGKPVSEPVIRFTTFQNSSIEFLVIVRVSEFSDQGLVKHELIKRIHERYKKEKIEIPYPIQTVYLQNQN